LYLNRHLPPNYVAYSEQSLQIAGDGDDMSMAVVIREVTGGAIGRVVARLELLSPSNKPGGAHYAAYKTRRYECVKGGVPLIEVDYLHESQTVVPGHPVYPNDVNAHAYTIAVNDPRPEHEKTQVYGFDVDQRMPPVPIPLAGEAGLVTDFETIYQSHFELDRLYMGVDYGQLPERFETYSAADQDRIRARMAAVAREYQQD
jgi:hypothetical protein